MTDIWQSGVYIGESRSIARCTIQKPRLYVHAANHGQRYASWVLAQMRRPRELPNVKSVEWDRDPSNGAASATITLYNTKPLPVGATPAADGRFDQVGYYTYNRGSGPYAGRWGHVANSWQGYLVYDRIIRTYEGYGFDADVAPEQDPNLVITGTWTIDDVDYDSRPGLIVVTCRDGAGPLSEDVCFPPVVPLKHYPLAFTKFKTVDGPPQVDIDDSGWNRPTLRTDSGYEGGYVGFNASLYGHQPADAYDSDQSTYWLSIGNDRPSADYSYEYVEGTISGTITGVRVHVWGGPYRVYIGVYADGAWQGRATVPYNAADVVSAPNHANERFVKAVNIDENDTVDITFKAIPSATRLRVTLTHLNNSGLGEFPYRAGVRDVRYTGSVTTTTPTTKTIGNYDDYTDIVKLLLAYGGFWWPAAHHLDKIAQSDGSVASYPCPSDDSAIGHGRVWGDFEETGTHGDATLTVDIFDKKPLLDGINYIRDIVSFLFMVDEQGGAIFRSPNIWKVGNVIGDLAINAGRTTDVITIDERNTLIELHAKVSGLNIREHIFVANVNGRIGAAAKGHNPYPTNRRRTGGWTDQHFKTKKECQIMADLISLRQYMLMRQDSITIPGYPAIQVDDQVRIVEEVTAEGYLHYVSGIRSSNDMESGKWTYELTTNWLGDSPGVLWLWSTSMFTADTLTYLRSQGKVPPE